MCVVEVELELEDPDVVLGHRTLCFHPGKVVHSPAVETLDSSRFFYLEPR